MPPVENKEADERISKSPKCSYKGVDQNCQRKPSILQIDNPESNHEIKSTSHNNIRAPIKSLITHSYDIDIDKISSIIDEEITASICKKKISTIQEYISPNIEDKTCSSNDETILANTIDVSSRLDVSDISRVGNPENQHNECRLPKSVNVFTEAETVVLDNNSTFLDDNKMVDPITTQSCAKDSNDFRKVLDCMDVEAETVVLDNNSTFLGDNKMVDPITTQSCIKDSNNFRKVLDCMDVEAETVVLDNNSTFLGDNKMVDPITTQSCIKDSNNFRKVLDCMEYADLKNLYDCVDTLSSSSMKPVSEKEVLINSMTKMITDTTKTLHVDSEKKTDIVVEDNMSTKSKMNTTYNQDNNMYIVTDSNTSQNRDQMKTTRHSVQGRRMSRHRTHSNEGVVDVEYMSKLHLIETKYLRKYRPKKSALKGGSKRLFHGAPLLKVGSNMPYDPRIIILEVENGEVAPVDPRTRKMEHEGMPNNVPLQSIAAKKVKINHTMENNVNLSERIKEQKAISGRQTLINNETCSLGSSTSNPEMKESLLKFEKSKMLAHLNSSTVLPNTPTSDYDSQDSLETLCIRNEALKAALYLHDKKTTVREFIYSPKYDREKDQITFNPDPHCKQGTEMQLSEPSAMKLGGNYEVEDTVLSSVSILHGQSVADSSERKAVLSNVDEVDGRWAVSDGVRICSSMRNDKARSGKNVCHADNDYTHSSHQPSRKRGHTERSLPQYYRPSAAKYQKPPNEQETDDTTLLHEITEYVEKDKRIVSKDRMRLLHNQDNPYDGGKSNSRSRDNSFSRYSMKSEIASRKTSHDTKLNRLHMSPMRYIPIKTMADSSHRGYMTKGAKRYYADRPIRSGALSKTSRHGSPSRPSRTPIRGPRTPPGEPRSPIYRPQQSLLRHSNLRYEDQRDYTRQYEAKQREDGTTFSPIYIQ